MKVLIAALLLLSAPAAAVLPDEMLADPALEARARTISRDLRCVVCQNQSIDDSDAPLARDLRLVVREQLTLGKSDTETIDYLVTRYGNFVLLKPPDEPPEPMLSLLASHARKPPSLRLVAPLPEPALEAWFDRVMTSMSVRSSTPFLATSRASSDLRPAFEVLSWVREMMMRLSEICV